MLSQCLAFGPTRTLEAASVVAPVVDGESAVFSGRQADVTDQGKWWEGALGKGQTQQEFQKPPWEQFDTKEEDMMSFDQNLLRHQLQAAVDGAAAGAVVAVFVLSDP